jgi:heptosyltransferase-2
MNAERTEPWIPLTLDERLSARERLATLSRPVLGINPGASYGSAKRWFPERFAEVANWFIRDTGGSVVIFGGKKETDIAEEIDKSIIDHKLFLAGKTTLRELISLISECDVLVTNDSGPMHIAYGVGTPLVTIFGSTAPELTGYADHRSAVLRNDFDCSPCFERTCKSEDMKCMWSISSDDVYIETRRLLPHKKAVFLDRDGTLCRDAGYLNSWDDFKVFPEIANLRRLKEKGFLLIGLSNQSGIARGIVERSFVEEVNRLFVETCGFDDFSYCPHHPDDHCPCRKPEPGMVIAARARHKINLRESYVVGDKDADMLLARAVGSRGILVKTGQQDTSSFADSVAANLKEAVDLIVSHDCI